MASNQPNDSISPVPEIGSSDCYFADSGSQKPLSMSTRIDDMINAWTNPLLSGTDHSESRPDEQNDPKQKKIDHGADDQPTLAELDATTVTTSTSGNGKEKGKGKRKETASPSRCNQADSVVQNQLPMFVSLPEGTWELDDARGLGNGYIDPIQAQAFMNKLRQLEGEIAEQRKAISQLKSENKELRDENGELEEDRTALDSIVCCEMWATKAEELAARRQHRDFGNVL